jgi:hypothetical protein
MAAGGAGDVERAQAEASHLLDDQQPGRLASLGDGASSIFLAFCLGVGPSSYNTA